MAQEEPEVTLQPTACGDPVDDDEPRRAVARQLEIEREQDRRELAGQL